MDLSEEIKDRIKKEIIRENKGNYFALISLMILSILIFGVTFYAKLHVGFHVANGILLCVVFAIFFSVKKPLDEKFINEWFMSQPSQSLFVYEIDKLIQEKWKGERQKIHLKEYEIEHKSEKRILSFMYDGKEITYPLNEVKYDEGEKRIEFYLSDRDWTVNIQKGTWVNVQIYNV